MSIINRAWNATKRTARKISDKTEELIDNASASIKIKNLEMKIDDLYEALGRIVYRDLHTEDDLEEEKLETIAQIDALFDRIAELKAEKAAKTETEEATEEAKETPEAECECCDACKAEAAEEPVKNDTAE